MKHWRRLTLRASAPHLPLGWWPFFVCIPCRTARKFTAGPLPHPCQSPPCPRDRLKPPRGISWGSLGHLRHPFLLMCRTSKPKFLPPLSNIVSVSWERGPNASRLYCKTGNVSIRPPLHLSFLTVMDFSSVEGRPLWRFSNVLTSARCTQISRWVIRWWGSSAMWIWPGSNISRENPRRSASPHSSTRLFF